MLWKILVEQNGEFKDSGIRIETDDPHAWIEKQHALDLHSYAAVKADTGLLALLKQGWAKLKGLVR